MSELLPTVQAERIRRSLIDYLTTTFALADADVRDALDRFLSDADSGMFKGPYARLRLPFRPAAAGWRDTLEWYAGPTPYGHQASAFSRLASAVGGRSRRPLPTLVTTGTGSGKTEAFLHPILDHVLRARRAGVTGTKALILYPMNALANDQAQRLTGLLTTHPELSGVTAALYTGQDGPTRTSVTSEGLITDRAIIRDTAPDILLTNYKMLDQLLLRPDDQRLWQQSATSLQYLVLDEFHTYDGAQGTDVAMLLRRLGLALKSYWPADDPSVSQDDRARPLGRITPVATSATLGDRGDPEAMLGFAETIFGEPFGPDAVVTESRLTLDEWSDGATDRLAALGLVPADANNIDLDAALTVLAKLGTDPAGADLTAAFMAQLYTGAAVPGADADPRLLLDLIRAHPLLSRIVSEAADAVALDDLVAAVFDDTVSFGRHGRGADWVRLFSHAIAVLGHVRSVAGRDAPAVEVHFWIRELTRIDRAADSTPSFRWADDGPLAVGDDHESVRTAFPAVYCRHCGRSGWGVGLSPVGESLATDDANIRRNHVQREGRFRALISAPAEAERALAGTSAADGLAWFSVAGRTLVRHTPHSDDPELLDGQLLPVLTLGPDDNDAARHDVCPACGQADAIRFLGSAIATLLSVSVSTLFGSGSLDPNEKKSLFFTDSVQDASHRAGFIQARSHTLTLRGVLRAGVADGALTLDQLVAEVMREAGDDPFARYRLLAPDCADRPSFEAFWKADTARSVPTAVRTRVAQRLALDVALEFGLNSRLGRTLELTGTVAAEVDAGGPARMAATARSAVADYAWQETTDGPPADGLLVTWVRGVLDRMRTRGSIGHPWFERFIQQDGLRWSIWGGRPRSDGMPAFPSGRPAPGFPRVGGGKEVKVDNLDAVTSSQSWYAQWTSQLLHVPRHDGGLLCKLLLAQLVKDRVLTGTTSDSGATVYAIPPTAVVVAPTTADDLAAGRHMVACDICQATTPGSMTTVDQLVGAPCLVARCAGRLTRHPIESGFYRALYASPDMRRVVAREHTSLLDDAERLLYENGFKAGATNPQSPNVLVATPTLEMGIDIGDLSSVMLASLPRSVASYLQRVGRAGRLTGNALNLAYVTGRGEQLPKLGEPLSVINGQVRPPATYLQADEILRRQYVAHLADGFARDPARPHPRRASTAMGSTDPDSFLGELVAFSEADAEGHVQRFTAEFADIGQPVVDELLRWVRPEAGPRTSPLAIHLERASLRWRDTVQTLKQRLDRLDAVLPELEAKKGSPAATDEDERAWRSAKATRKMTTGQLAHLQREYWIAVLEEYGILPNYTLLGDIVLLDVGVSWVDPDTGDFHSEHGQIERSGVRAIREFAPGAVFYGRGYEIEIDALDLGADGAAVRPWVFCPMCGFAEDIGLTGSDQQPARCPRCGSTGIADTGQRLSVVELTHVSSEIRRDEATISDRRDERTNKLFQILVTAEVDESVAVDRWYVAEVGLGITYARSVTMRWLNLGSATHGPTRWISGEERTGGLFRVCRGCGKRDLDLGRNRAHEHRPWCQYRTSAVEHDIDVALSKTLHTQGLFVRLPFTISLGDDFAVPSLSAALLLGLREQLGGDPDHIGVQRVVEPTLTDGSDNHVAILLHDLVPGGTGYLAELADPDRMGRLMLLAYERVRDCECRFENRLSCHRCLLPFAPPGATRRVSRATAERHLRGLLQIDIDAESDAPESPGWQVRRTPPAEDLESQLEQRFRQILLQRLRTTGAAINEVPGVWGNTVRFTLPGHRRPWTLTPQVMVENCRPDFVLQCPDPAIPPVAIFTDGRAYHATATHNRLADDAEKRDGLRDTGRVVLAITSRDLDQDATDADPPPWYSPSGIASVISRPQFTASSAAYERLRRGPVDWLIDWVSRPAPDETEKVARAVPLLMQGAALCEVPADSTLEQVARDRLDGVPSTGPRRVAVFRSGPLAVAFEPVGGTVRLAAVLDDRPSSLGPEHAAGWRLWLRLSNALACRDWPTVITTVSRVQDAAVAARPTPTIPDLPREWRQAWNDAADDSERSLLAALADLGELEVPQLGEEGPDGIMLDLSWPTLRIAVDLHGMDETDRADLETAGWQIIEPDAHLVAAGVRDRRITDSEEI